MQFSHEERGRYLLVNVSGRLDASWAEHFSATFREFIRQGHHHILLDAAEMSYLSSAGIRSLVQVTKSVMAVNGSLQIKQANSFVQQTLTMTGFDSWLITGFPEDMPAADAGRPSTEADAYETHLLDDSSALTLSVPARWQPWQAVNPHKMAQIRFGQTDFALGIAAPEQPGGDAKHHFGEFLAVGGNVVCQPPREGEKPDFLLAEKEYIPELQCIQALHCNGDMSHLFRFSPKGNKTCFGIGELAEKTLVETDSAMTAFVVIGEVDGLVGAALIRSPGLLNEDHAIPFPEVKEWLSFCGERVHLGQLALVVGLAARRQNGKRPLLLPASTFFPNLHLHAHAVVFPYQPLEAGIISLNSITGKLFNGPPPMALMHLVEDSRPVVGLGESAFIRGACWFAGITNDKEDGIWE
jgi:anti-anti-sigma factor